MTRSFWVFLATLAVASKTHLANATCEGEFECLTYTRYALCISNTLVGNTSCPTGQYCITGASNPCEVTETTAAPVTAPSECTGPYKYPAENCNQYYECVPFLWWYNLNLYNCSVGEAFDDDELTCVNNTNCNSETGQLETTTVATTTTEAPVTPPAECTGPDKYPAENCNQYYECVPFMWWYNLNLYNCSVGEAFNSLQLACVNDTSCDSETGQYKTTTVSTTTEPTTTTEAAPVTPPAECTGADKYPAENCNQYYECVPVFWWYNLNLYNCSVGEAFDSLQLECVNNTSCNSETGQYDTTTTSTTTTIEPTTTTESTTQAPVTPPSECTSARKYPAENCNQYYECVPFLWWYNLNLYNCSEGEAFDNLELVCVANTSCSVDSGQFETTVSSVVDFTTATESTTITSTTQSTTTSTTQSTISTTQSTISTTQSTISTTQSTISTTESTEAITPPSACTSASKYPAENCNQYYECVPVLWWYNLNLYNCSSGQAFSSVELTCVSNSSCIV